MNRRQQGEEELRILLAWVVLLTFVVFSAAAS